MGQSSIDSIGTRYSATSQAQTASEHEQDILTTLLKFAGEPSPERVSAALLGAQYSLHDILSTGGKLSLLGEIGEQTQIFLESVGQALTAVLTGPAFSKPVIGSSKALHDLLRFKMGALRCEQLRVLYLDAGKNLIIERLLAAGNINAVHVEPREIIRLALQCDATGLILVHNHPSDCAKPSHKDLVLTDAIISAAALYDIALIDHLIVTKKRVCSLRVEGYLDDNSSS